MKGRKFIGFMESESSHAFLLVPVLTINIPPWVPIYHTSRLIFCRCGHTMGMLRGSGWGCGSCLFVDLWKTGSQILDVVPVHERSFIVRSQLLLIHLGRPHTVVSSGLYTWVLPPTSALRNLCLNFPTDSSPDWASPSLNAIRGSLFSSIYRYFAV